MSVSKDSDSIPRLVWGHHGAPRRGPDLERFLNLWRLALLAVLGLVLLVTMAVRGSLPVEEQWGLAAVVVFLMVAMGFQVYLTWFPWSDSFPLIVVSADLAMVTGALLGCLVIDRAIVATNSQISFFGYFLLVALAGVRSDQRVARSVAVAVPLSYAFVVFLAVAWREVSFAPSDPVYGAFRWHVQVARLLILAAVTWVIHLDVALGSSDRALAQRDPLTGLFNRRFLEEFLGRELPRARAAGEPLSALVLDLDGFKEFNDLHGHLEGDRVLAQVGASLSAAVRAGDVLVRYGGDEFVVVLPNTTGETARRIGRDLQRAIPGEIGMSAGVACLGEGVTTAQQLLAAADAALFRAKQMGRGTVEAG